MVVFKILPVDLQGRKLQELVGTRYMVGPTGDPQRTLHWSRRKEGGGFVKGFFSSFFFLQKSKSKEENKTEKKKEIEKDL